MKQVTHRDIEKAVDRLNHRRGLTRHSKGWLMYRDIKGNGTYRPSFYARTMGEDNPACGVVNVASLYRGKTMRETLANIEGAN